MLCLCSKSRPTHKTAKTQIPTQVEHKALGSAEWETLGPRVPKHASTPTRARGLAGQRLFLPRCRSSVHDTDELFTMMMLI